MLLDFYNKHKRAVVISLLILVAAIVAWSIYYNFISFHITRITPNPSSASYLAPKLEIEFNKDISSDNLSVTSNDLSVQSYVAGKRSLRIDITTQREVGKTYIITINTLFSTNGDAVRNHQITLHALADGTLSQDDQDILLQNQDEERPAALSDPIASHTPYSTLSYSIESLGTKNAQGKLVVTITIILSNADVSIDREGAIKAAKKDAMNYLKSFSDLDLKNYSFEYTIREP